MILSFGKPFKGTAPRLGSTQLPPGYGQVANDVKLRSGELRPIGAPVGVVNLNPGPSSGSPVQTLFRYETVYWMNWREDVRVHSGPLLNDTLGRLFWTGDGAYPKKADRSTLTSGGASGPLPAGSYTLGVKTPENEPTPNGGGHNLGASTDQVDVVYVYTFVTSWGEESAPSPPLIIENVPDDTWDDTGTTYLWLDFPDDDPGGNYNLAGGTMRIYRTVDGIQDRVHPFLFVAEVAIGSATTANSGYKDSKSAKNLNEQIPSYRAEQDVLVTWDEPPAGLQGLTALAGGVFAGFVGRTVYFSEPYEPHAWPAVYAREVTHDIVAMGVSGFILMVVMKSRKLQPLLVTVLQV